MIRKLLYLGTTDDGRAFDLPPELVTQTLAILAKRGVGKSYLAGVIAEEFLSHGLPIILIDPTGAHWGLRSSANGEQAGFPIVVMGGDHADIPLDHHSGEVIAKSIVEQGFSAILDLSLMRKGEASMFMGIFLETLYRLNREPRHLICDEADTFAPQQTRFNAGEGTAARTLGAMEDVAKKGRIRGLGMTLITQRPQVLNKNVLTQCEVLVAMRLVHPKDIKAIEEWVGVHGDPAQAKLMIGSLPSLPVGTAWFWAPAWGDIFAKVKVRARTTFDSGATPKPGVVVKAPKQLARIDIERLGKEIAATLKKIEDDDPKLLRKQISELQNQLASNQPAKAEVQVQRVEVSMLTEEQIARLEAAATSMSETGLALTAAACEISQALLTAHSNPVDAPRPLQPRAVAAPAQVQRRDPPARAADGTGLPKSERLILMAIAQRAPRSSTRAQASVLSGYSVTSSSFSNALGALRSKGLLDGQGDDLRVTQAGVAALGHFDPLPTGKALVSFWNSKLAKAERLFLTHLADHFPREVTKDALSQATGYSITSSSFSNALGKLRTLELITGRNELRASPDLFETSRQ